MLTFHCLGTSYKDTVPAILDRIRLGLDPVSVPSLWPILPLRAPPPRAVNDRLIDREGLRDPRFEHPARRAELFPSRRGRFSMEYSRWPRDSSEYLEFSLLIVPWKSKREERHIAISIIARTISRYNFSFPFLFFCIILKNYYDP